MRRGSALLGRYAAAFENADITALTRLLRDDAVFEMPPLPTWFTGRELIGRFLGSRVLGEPGDIRMIPTAANGQPSLAAYLRGHDGAHRAHAIRVLTVTGSSFARIVSFNDPGLFATFGLPQAPPPPLTLKAWVQRVVATCLVAVPSADRKGYLPVGCGARRALGGACWAWPRLLHAKGAQRFPGPGPAAGGRVSAAQQS